ncbi:hypothetical protein PC129_g8116 [Phytophthora cactorum]|uniref:PiggyBac transposable element-derived protein domain-containing protein n=1 Tax=Phytophthora cactorum TaxID=29920 RepID=A0A329S1H8_9STRA|nr:hypothetical protein GQ600_22928 [Phytophthora cactorum]KAG2759593.1 hypothetical protein Pcac1_g28411 [Phytophthora cactorum]KAG2905780.1 hypothetical protein PC114_g11402 [Phytophthora cactorum]KAG2919864.1 hypothetical protein PC115_g9970 [Phytophthora cactorum]KAG2981766.1 hypothetical protein PC118_g10398 [Phytophthora cactorum]
MDADNELEQDALSLTRAAPVDEEEETKDTEATSTQDTTRSAPGRTGNIYTDGIELERRRHINHEANVPQAYSERQEVGLFSLFFNGTHRERLRTWMNHSMCQQGKPEVSTVEFDAYMGIEIAMSILPKLR